MSEVKLSVGGRDYTVACAEGEEAHVAKLGEIIDGKLQEMGSNLSPQESQNLLFGALLIADELHEAKKAASAAQTTLDNHALELAEAQRKEALASGQKDELKQTISDLEQELGGLQSANQRHSSDVDGLREELERKSQALASAEAETAKLAAELSAVTNERDSQAKQIKNKDELLERANMHLNEKNAQLAEARDSATALDTVVDPDMAPALERFADLLESCADKLEGKAASA